MRLSVYCTTLNSSKPFTIKLFHYNSTRLASNCVSGLKKPTILVHKPGPKVPIGDGRPVVSPVGSDITELAFVKITLTCPTEGTPPPQITWKKDGVELVPGERYVIDNKGSLTIPEAATEDSGNFTCSAQNAAGVEEVTSLIDILGTLSHNSLFTVSESTQESKVYFYFYSD